MEYRDYYATLGVPRTASQAEVRKAFRKLARQHHPDVNKGDTRAEQRFKEVSEANEVLSDPEKRKAYDQLGADWAAYQRAGAGPTGGFAGFSGGGVPGGVRFEFRGDPQDLAGFSEFFRTFFAGATAGAGGTATAGAARATSGWSTRRAERELDREPLFGGIGGETGDGHGSSNFGTGRARGTRPPAPPRRDATVEAVIGLEEVLHGTERVIQSGGSRLEVRIPPGVRDGQRIRLSGKADGGGDVYLTVHVRPHRVFSRNGANLSRELPIGLGQALLGDDVAVETLSGRKLLLTIPAGTQNGRVFRLSGQGLPKAGQDGRGDLLVKTRVVLPPPLDEEGTRLARALVDHLEQTGPRVENAAAAT